MVTINRGILWILFLFGNIMISTVLGWGSSDKIKLTDVNVITLHQGKMTNSRRTHAVPQLRCVGGSAGCSAFMPRVVQCYNRGSDGYDVQWECKTDMDSRYRFGEIAVNCEGYSYPDDPYVLKGSCGLEYNLDVVGGGHYHSYHDSGHRDRGYHDHHHNYHTRQSGGSWLGSIVMWGIIAYVAYYIYQQWTRNANTHTQEDYAQSSRPPPAGFRPEYVPDEQTSGYGTSGYGSGVGGGGFWTGAATGGFLGYLFGSSGRQAPYYNNYGSYGTGYHRPRTGWGLGGSNWLGSNNSWSSGWSSGSSYRQTPSPPSTRTSSGFGGTKRR